MLITKNIIIHETCIQRNIFGDLDTNLKFIEKKLSVRISGHGKKFNVSGMEDSVHIVEHLLSQLNALLLTGFTFKNNELKSVINLVCDEPLVDLIDFFSDKNQIDLGRQVIKPKGISQKEYIYKIKSHDVVFGIGPAGTGKTFLAVAMAVESLLNRKKGKIVLTRPAVEAGEKLGFLPGDLYEKVNPFLRPLYDALNHMLGFEKAAKMMKEGVIEVAPLAFMRGRTLNDSFIILDEAQNCSSEQMKMTLTRLGINSKIVVTGDVTQIDLPDKTISGLVEAKSLLEGTKGIGFSFFSEKDVVRHSLVRSIIKAYDKKRIMPLKD